MKKNPGDQPRCFQFPDQQVILPIARIGISVESVDKVQQQISALESTKINPTQITNFSQKMLENFLNYAGSYAVQQSQMIRNPTENYVPLSVVQMWYSNFQRKLEYDPNFWRT